MALNFVNGDDLFDRGVALHSAGRLGEAAKLYEAVLAANPNHMAALNNLAVIAIHSGQGPAAITLLQRAVAINPHNAEVHNAMGEAYRAMRSGDKALECYAKAIEIDPRLVSAYNNRGIVQALMGHIVDAVKSWEQAIAISGTSQQGTHDRALTYNNLGNGYLEQGEVARAVENHRKACELEPSNTVFHSNLLRDRSHSSNLTPEQMLAEHKEWWQRHAGTITPMQHPRVGDPEKKLRIGFVSPDFREHSVTYFLMGLFDHYDRERFDFICYGNVTAADQFTQWIVKRATTYRSLLAKTDQEVTRMISDDRIDVLIDLAGHTAGNRLRLFAYRSAPVQASYLGYPQTTGASVIDWRITDALADPPGMTESHYSEKLWRLNRPAWCYHVPVEIPSEETPPVKGGRPFTFGSFNNYSKVTAEMITLWSRILKATPGSRMMLKAMALRDDAICDQVRQRFAHEGITADRLLFSGKQNTTVEHLARYAEVDLSLDTFPYHGTTTTCEALWMNVPVITLEGKTHASRVGVSLLSAMKLHELIAHDEEEYLGIAVAIANDHERLAKLRKGLRERMRQSPLMDESGFARDFGEALRGMWRQWCQPTR